MSEKPVSPPPASEMLDDPSDRNHAFDEALFAAGFNDLPAVKALRRSFAMRQVAEDDPARVLLEVCAKFDERLTALANRQLASGATFHDAVEKFRDAIFHGAPQWEGATIRLARVEKQCQALEQQLALVLNAVAQAVPALDRAGADVVQGARLIEGRSVHAVLVRYLVPLLAFGLGVSAAAFLLHR